MFLYNRKYLEEEEKEIEELIDEASKNYRKEIELLDTIPGAKAIISEIGVDMNQFPTVKNLTSWAGMSPGNNESAGVKKMEKAQKEIEHYEQL